jgi:hypothetical protein
MHRVKKRRAYPEDTFRLRIVMEVATQLDQLCINSSAYFQLMLCSGHSADFPVRPECGNEQTHLSGASMLLNLRTVKDDSCMFTVREISASLPKEPLIKSIMNRVADKNGMIARRATPVVVILRCQGAQHSERPFLSQPARALALRAVCCVRLLAKGITIRVVAFLASHPAKPNARPCGT